jgi:HSP20 family protein
MSVYIELPGSIPQCGRTFVSRTLGQDQGAKVMRATRWQSFEPVVNQLQQFQGEMSRIFDHWLGASPLAAAGYPPLNVWEEGEHVWVEAELPGLDPASLELTVSSGNELTIKGERKKQAPEKGVWLRQERETGAFSRSLTLPFPVDPDKVDARLEQGVLRVRLAKHESARPRKINVKAE